MGTTRPEPAGVKVSVAMITYNHERFIAQAIESALMQQTDFEVELVIGEDCSTDGTREIVRAYGERYPERVRPLLHEHNLGLNGHNNVRATLKACRGEYVALLEGDDFWTDPHKLQKQTRFFESHPECVICFHNVARIYEDGDRDSTNLCPADQKEISSIEDLLVTDFIPTCSTLFRRGLVSELPDWVSSLKMSDWPFLILNAQHGKIGYINQVMGAYRIHAGGAWSSLDNVPQLRACIEMWGHINSHLNFKYENIIGEEVSNHWGSLAVALVTQAAVQGRTPLAANEVLEQFERWSIQSTLSRAWKTRSLGKIYAGLLFASHGARSFAVARRYWLKAIQYDPSWLRNPGVWSIGVEAFLGQRAARLLRKLAGEVL
jgi:glycosyltransferase involved in cell wall biosynthesis